MTTVPKSVDLVLLVDDNETDNFISKRIIEILGILCLLLVVVASWRKEQGWMNSFPEGLIKNIGTDAGIWSVPV